MSSRATIKISRRSWHLRLAKKLENKDWEPRDLCHYIRTIVLDLVLLVILVSLVIAAAGILSVGLYFGIVGLLGLGVLHWVILGIALASGIVFGGIKGIIWLRRRHRDMPPKPSKGDSIVKAWYKAHKEKYCPKTEVVE